MLAYNENSRVSSYYSELDTHVSQPSRDDNYVGADQKLDSKYDSQAESARAGAPSITLEQHI